LSVNLEADDCFPAVHCLNLESEILNLNPLEEPTRYRGVVLTSSNHPLHKTPILHPSSFIPLPHPFSLPQPSRRRAGAPRFVFQFTPPGIQSRAGGA